ncbi:hypothetical protein ACFFGF_08385 [Asaia lannensis]|uniref:Transposase n=1 Tax=Asaia lannensis NBRC 102526 TaxID=1307926 RepID=A0ABT1CHS6_9PROT|nr:hypothetical protein [Asaia lannensis]MCO6160414.1 hypothetical protein [Asaia lannensis NBRC 102526]
MRAALSAIAARASLAHFPQTPRKWSRVGKTTTAKGGIGPAQTIRLKSGKRLEYWIFRVFIAKAQSGSGFSHGRGQQAPKKIFPESTQKVLPFVIKTALAFLCGNRSRFK